VYTKFNNGIGRVSAFAPGTKENSAVFSHACAFKIVADCMMKRGNSAYETFIKVLPTYSLKAKNMSHYKAEPYVFAEYVVGPNHPENFGRGEFTWNTGTTTWMFIAATAWILGVRPNFRGLEIDPCLPEQWTHCHIKRAFRGAFYEISINKSDHTQSGGKRIIVDNKEIKTRIIKPHRDGKVHKVEVIM
ncbi:MAG: glycosyl transferase, partial [Candidatus Marinimicrobia bacterium]|nr:glycosyl transferase [Candidatus Neomarinimicrobiota bacterium]